jgi:hypothetical protein
MGSLAPEQVEPLDSQVSPGTVGNESAGQGSCSRQTVPLRVVLDPSTHDKLHYAQALLSHVVPSRDVAQVLDRALDALIAQLEKRKFAATGKPRRSKSHSSSSRRYIPAEIKRQVRQRDGGKCTFVSDTGRRCSSRTRLEFDHVLEVARGGQTTAENLRLRVPSS